MPLPDSLRSCSALLLLCAMSVPATAAEPPGVAIVELFTSEGCRSCPAADRVLAQIVSQQAKSKVPVPVYGLVFHVDYWDRLGWPDRFAHRRYTERQQLYARVLESDRVYTPQMIVNGRTEFVGSNTKLADLAIQHARAAAPQVAVQASLLRLDKDKVRVRYDLDKLVTGTVLNVALVETDLTTNVRRGENSGATLKHANAVRVWETVDPPPGRTDHVELTVPKDLRHDHSRVIVYIQNRETMEVLGATQTDLLSLAKTDEK